ncbi:unnamed protein product [Rodentolepis nana]|uniref:GST N-terminal domain-containing protein n=1 Tax=Rodentolepis nana TaxID=102285 RepID=A0A0R3T6E4_RODNA|nr:unnamed protein product [Rodentolepis nana]
MASCCGCCGKENDDATLNNAGKADDEVFETEPAASELEYIDEFLESRSSSGISRSDSSLNGEEPVDEKLTVLQTAPSAESRRRNMETIIPKFGYWNIRGLPYWIEGDIRISESSGIMQHIAEKHRMLPSDENIRKELREVDDEINELRSAFEEFSNDKEHVNYPDFNLYDLLDMLRTLAPEILAIHLNLENFMLRFELGQQIRLLLTYCGEKFDQEFYIAGPGM